MFLDRSYINHFESSRDANPNETWDDGIYASWDLMRRPKYVPSFSSRNDLRYSQDGKWGDVTLLLPS